MKRFGIYLLVSLVLQFISVVNANAQNQKIDSLLKVSAKSNLHDTIKLNVFNQLSEEYIRVNSSEAMPYAQKALKISEKYGNKHGAARAYTNMGTYYMYDNKLDTSFFLYNKALSVLGENYRTNLYAELQKKKGVIYFYNGKTDSALYFFKNSLTVYEQLKDSLEVIKAYNNIGAISLKTRKLDQAISYFFKCLFFDEAKNDLKSIASDYNNIGIALTDKKDFLAAETYLRKSIKIRENLFDSIGIARASINLGNVYTGQKKHKKTIDLLSGLYTILNENDYPDEYSQLLNNLGSSYMHLNQYDHALELLNQSLKIKRIYNINKELDSTLGNIGVVYAKKKNYPLAIKYCLEADTIASQNGHIEFQLTARIVLTESYLKTNQSNLAFASFQLLQKLNEQFYNLNSAQQIAEIQTKYETQKKENANKLLEQQNDIKQLEITNNQARIRNKNTTIVILLISILFLIILVIWRINVMNLKKKQQELIATQKLQKEKERISRDLHDNVGGQLSFVLLSIEGIADEEKNKREEVVKSINESVRNVIGNLRETIWAINDENIFVHDLSDKLKVYSRNIFRHSGVQIKFSENIEDDIPMNALVGLNLFRMCQEVINNAYKHANATIIEINIKSQKNIIITIADNGKGFDNNLNTEGYGLSNIKKRAEETGITVYVESSIGKGVNYKLIV